MPFRWRLISRKHNIGCNSAMTSIRQPCRIYWFPTWCSPRTKRVRLSTFSATLIRDTRDKPLDAHRGSFRTSISGLPPTALGSSANFAKFFGQICALPAVHSLSSRTVFALGWLHRSRQLCSDQPIVFLGGGTSLRGFPIDGAGPQRLVPFCNVLQGQSGCVNITVPVGGKQLFILNSELRFPLGIMKALGGVVFYDGGNVYNAINLQQFHRQLYEHRWSRTEVCHTDWASPVRYWTQCESGAGHSIRCSISSLSGRLFRSVMNWNGGSAGRHW